MAGEPSNNAIAEALEELGDLYELDGAIVHRVLAYRSGARAVREAPVSVAALAREGRATELAGIGATLQEKILALAETGTIPAMEKLRAKIPPGLVALTRLPGVGPKRVRMLHSTLGIDSLESLRAAAAAGRLRDVKGLGPKFEAGVLESLQRMEEDPDAYTAPRLLLPKALALGQALADGLTDIGGAGTEVMLAGSARRMADSVKDIDLIAVTRKPVALAKRLGIAARDRSGLLRRQGGRSRAQPYGREHRPAHRQALPAGQPVAALHGLGKAQRRPARSGRAQRPARVRVRGRKRRDRRHDDVCERAGGVRVAGPGLHRARAARGSRRAGRRLV